MYIKAAQRLEVEALAVRAYYRVHPTFIYIEDFS